LFVILSGGGIAAGVEGSAFVFSIHYPLPTAFRTRAESTPRSTRTWIAKRSKMVDGVYCGAIEDQNVNFGLGAWHEFIVAFPLASLDDSLTLLRESLGKLKATKSVEMTEVIKQLDMAAESARIVRAWVLSELSEASWQNRQERTHSLRKSKRFYRPGLYSSSLPGVGSTD